MRYLVTGANGFVGRNLVSKLLETGASVTSVVRLAGHDLPGETVMLPDPLVASSYDAIVGRVDAVVNLLAAGVHPSDRDPKLLYRANAQFPAELALRCAAAGVKAFLHLGSSAEYDQIQSDERLSETSPLEGVRLYGVTKAAGTLGVQAACVTTGMNFAVLRAFNIFGPGEAPHRLFPSVAKRIAAGERVAMSAGTQVRDFLYVDDASSAIARMSLNLASDRAQSGIFNLGSGNGVSVADFAHAVLKEVGGSQEQLDLGALPLRPDDLPYVVASTAKLEQVIGPIRTHGLSEAIQLGVKAMGIKEARR